MTGFPFASAVTGLSAALPSIVQVRYRTRRCTGQVADSIPDFYLEYIPLSTVLPSNLLSTMQGQGSYVITDDALALYQIGFPNPINQTALHNLAIQIATDYILWRTVSYDITFNGVIAPDPDAAIDLIQWNIDSTEISTRLISAPLNWEPDNYNHNDPANAGCVDMTLVVTSKTPCVETYVPLWTGPGLLTAYRSRICLEDGRLFQYYDTSDTFSCGCSGGGGPCITGFLVNVATCDPSQGNGILVTVKDQHGTIFVSGITSGGSAGFLSLGNCDPTATYTITISKTGFTTINEVIPICCCNTCPNIFNYYLFQTAIPTITVNFCVYGCLGFPNITNPNFHRQTPGLVGVEVGVTLPDGNVFCVTDTTGCCSIEFDSITLGNTYPVFYNGGHCIDSNDNYATVTDTCVSQVINEYIFANPGTDCTCFCCQQPRPDTLLLTDSVYPHPVTLTATPNGYIGSQTVGYFGSCGCPDADVTLIYLLSCNNGNYVLTMWWTWYTYNEVCGFIGEVHCCPGPASPIGVCNVFNPAGGLDGVTGPFGPGASGFVLTIPIGTCQDHLDIEFDYVGFHCGSTDHTFCPDPPNIDGCPCKYVVASPNPWKDGAFWTITE